MFSFDFDFISKASPVVLGVLLILVVLLYFTIWYILRKRFALRRYEKNCDDFDRSFWGGVSVEDLEFRVRGGEYNGYGLGQLFLAAQDEYKKASESGVKQPELILEGARRAMDVIILQQEELLNRHMLFLATVAGVSPYIGLLGTVWGIKNAIQSMTKTSQATIALVAPGIAEALIATAMGLLAAIPALIAYNYFSGRVERLQTRFDNFANHYINILHRNL